MDVWIVSRPGLLGVEVLRTCQSVCICEHESTFRWGLCRGDTAESQGVNGSGVRTEERGFLEWGIGLASRQHRAQLQFFPSLGSAGHFQVLFWTFR